jgi:hypothetical protein
VGIDSTACLLFVWTRREYKDLHYWGKSCEHVEMLLAESDLGHLLAR